MKLPLPLARPAMRVFKLGLRIIALVAVCLPFYLTSAACRAAPFLLTRAEQSVQALALSVTLLICGVLLFDTDLKRMEK